MSTPVIVGNSAFVWKIKDLPNNPLQTPAETAKRAYQLGFQNLMVKIANGSQRYNLRKEGENYTDTLIGPFIEACAQYSINVWGWQYIYADYPNQEAACLVNRINLYPDLAGIIIDAETEIKKANPNAVSTYLRAIKPLLDRYPIGLSTYRFPSLHTDFPWQDFVAFPFDVLVPQVYWAKANNPAEQLARCLSEYTALWAHYGKSLPQVCPAGAAYHEHGWQPTIPEMLAFAERATQLELPAITWWEWAHAERYNLTPGLAWTPTNPPPPAPPPLTIEQRLEDLVLWAIAKGYTPPQTQTINA